MTAVLTTMPPEVSPAGPGPSFAERARAWVVVVAALVSRLAVAGWRFTRTRWALFRLRRLWPEIAGQLGLADKRQNVQGGRMRTRFFHVPKLRRATITQHGWSQAVRLRPGQTPLTYVDHAGAIAHAARVQSVKVVDLPHAPGFAELRFLRRDPLSKVLERPRALSDSRFVVGSDENGDVWEIDFSKFPHWLFAGTTGSGKSGLLAALLSAIGETDAVMIGWDLKFGVEAASFSDRYSMVCETQIDVHRSAAQILEVAADRAAIFKALGVRSIEEARDLGVALRRIFIVVDEVAEVGLDYGEVDEEGKKLVESIQVELLSIVQRVRAFGIHVVLCGQRFGSDAGSKATSIRAQVSGRVCLKVSDVETAKMTLPNLDKEVHARVMSLDLPGKGIAADGPSWFYGRSTYLTVPEIRAVAAAHAGKVLPLAQLGMEDTATFNRFRGEG